MTNRKKEQVRKKRFTLNLLFTLLIFLQLVLTMGLVIGVIALLIQWDVLSFGTTKPETNHLLLYIAVTSVILGSLLSSIVSRQPLKPVNEVINAMNRLASGDFKTRLHFGSWFSRFSVADELSQSFNIMAEELENTELLRSDFVNNFSHEFKTPIVSIAGFASLLKRGNLTEEKKIEYIGVIEEESMRLSAMATNVLNLSKVENQTILRDVTTFNLSEQIRACVLLLESKWSKKNLEWNLDFEEYDITANDELLKQIWINLIDNAIKFSPEYGELNIRIAQTDDTLSVSIVNPGAPIPGDKQERIFQKFYQADESHATEGNGIGLAVAKKVAELHQGSISVQSEAGKTAFTVTLPKERIAPQIE